MYYPFIDYQLNLADGVLFANRLHSLKDFYHGSTIDRGYTTACVSQKRSSRGCVFVSFWWLSS